MKILIQGQILCCHSSSQQVHHYQLEVPDLPHSIMDVSCCLVCASNPMRHL
jgi:hypothetical protein